MTKWIALFRGINVGGNNIMPMKEVRQAFESAGFLGVQTYIQSGNVVLSTDPADKAAMTKTIGALVVKTFAFNPKMMLLTAAELDSAISRNPFAEATQDPKSLHLFFLGRPAHSADLTAVEAVASATERFKLTDGVFYLHAPDGIGRSKLAAKVEKLLSVDITARNWNTVKKLQELVRKTE